MGPLYFFGEELIQLFNCFERRNVDAAIFVHLLNEIGVLFEQVDALGRSLGEIDAAWMERGKRIETLEVGLERNDVKVVQMALTWIPTS